MLAGSDSGGDGDGIRAQIDACFDAFRIGAVKLGVKQSLVESARWFPANHELHDNMEQPGRCRAQSGRLAAKVS